MVGVELQMLQAGLLPSGFGLPPLPYLVALVFGTLIVGVLMVVLRVEVTNGDVLAFGVWMAIGATVHTLYQIDGIQGIDAVPGVVEPLLGSPSVYLTTFILMGFVYLVASVGAAAEVFSSSARILGGVGVLVWIVLLGYLFTVAPAINPLWPTAGLFVSVILAALGFIALSLAYTEAAVSTGQVGAFVVFAHTLDGVSTAIGVDVLCEGTIRACEQTPLPRLIMGVAADLNLPVDIGVGWLFVLTKVVLAVVIVAVFADYIDDAPSRGRAAMALLAAVGLGPGVYNLLLFLFTNGPA
jgi:uncharacterized membrane protein